MRSIKSFIAYILLAILTALPSLAADPALDLLVAQALEQNPGLQALQHHLQAAIARQQEARASYYPQFSTTANYTRTDNAPQAFMLQLQQRQLDMQDPAFDPNQPDDTTNWQLGLGLQYPLLDPARQARQQAANLGQDLSRAHLAAARNALVHAVTQGYYQVLEAQAFTTVQQAAQASYTESLRVARARYDSGAVVRTDVLNLEVQLAQAQENLIRARNGVQLAIAALNATIGTEAIGTNGLPEPDLLVPPPESLPGHPAQRPEQTAATLESARARAQARAAAAQHWPTLQAFGSYQWDSETLDNIEDSYLAGVALQWNGFDGGRTRARTAAAQAHIAAMQARMHETTLQLQLDQKQANLRLQEAWERIQVSGQAAASAAEALRITRALYQEGAVDVATLLMAELARTETGMRATAARYDYLIARSNAQRAAGAFVSPATDSGE